MYTYKEQDSQIITAGKLIVINHRGSILLLNYGIFPLSIGGRKYSPPSPVRFTYVNKSAKRQVGLLPYMSTGVEWGGYPPQKVHFSREVSFTEKWWILPPSQFSLKKSSSPVLFYRENRKKIRNYFAAKEKILKKFFFFLNLRQKLANPPSCRIFLPSYTKCQVAPMYGYFPNYRVPPPSLLLEGQTRAQLCF